MLIDVFKISLNQTKIKNWKTKKSLLSDNNFLYTQDQNKDKINIFHSIFKEDIDNSLNELEVHDYKILDVWSLSYKNEKFHKIHNHRTVGFTGIIYANYDQIDHSPTSFIFPLNIPRTDINTIYSPENIEEGSMIIFPSILMHFTNPNLSEKERKIIAFDVMPVNNSSFNFI